ncbi:hypothetical protein [Streptomyces sp. NPDC059928]|uniref:hypothetical protein n=1 Tax=unclassified Streptomyces TaxID=2593676 RepID=UPI0036468A7B
MTLEKAADALNAITGGATDASLMSAWEPGRRRTGERNRAGLCQLYRERPEALFGHQHGPATNVLETFGTAVVVKVLIRWTDLVEAMVDVAAGAREQLVVTGSRSREKTYLAAIETAVAQRPDLVHYRVLYGPPRHRELADHLLRLLELRDPSLQALVRRPSRAGIPAVPPTGRRGPADSEFCRTNASTGAVVGQREGGPRPNRRNRSRSWSGR